MGGPGITPSGPLTRVSALTVLLVLTAARAGAPSRRREISQQESNSLFERFPGRYRVVPSDHLK